MAPAQVGQRIRALGYAVGASTGSQVAGRFGTIVDRAVDDSGLVMVRFPVTGSEDFYDWVDERHLVVL